MGLQGVKAVFFDLDNTLVDTAAAGRRAIQEVINVLQSKHQCDEGEAHMICDKVQEKLLKECHDPAKNMDHKMHANLETNKMVSINDVHDRANVESKNF
ncbi:unnamed protein product [Caretta caretta]